MYIPMSRTTGERHVWCSLVEIKGNYLFLYPVKSQISPKQSPLCTFPARLAPNQFVLKCSKPAFVWSQERWLLCCICNTHQHFLPQQSGAPKDDQGSLRTVFPSKTYTPNPQPAWHPSLSIRMPGWALVISVFVSCGSVFTAHRPCFLSQSTVNWWISNSVSPCGRRALHPCEFHELPWQ